MQLARSLFLCLLLWIGSSIAVKKTVRTITIGRPVTGAALNPQKARINTNIHKTAKAVKAAKLGAAHGFGIYPPGGSLLGPFAGFGYPISIGAGLNTGYFGNTGFGNISPYHFGSGNIYGKNFNDVFISGYANGGPLYAGHAGYGFNSNLNGYGGAGAYTVKAKKFGYPNPAGGYLSHQLLSGINGGFAGAYPAPYPAAYSAAGHSGYPQNNYYNTGNYGGFNNFNSRLQGYGK